jgi:hypothetical protein
VQPVSPILGSILSASSSENPERKLFWETLGKDFHVTKFPNMSPVHVQNKEVLVLAKHCSKPLQLLQKGCSDAGITLQSAGQASWARILASYTGEAIVNYGLVLSGRTLSEEAQCVVFPCLTTVPSQYHVEGRNRDLLQRILKSNSSLVRNQFTPLSKIHRWSNTDTSLFDTIFVYQKLPSASEEDGLWEIHYEEVKIDVSTMTAIKAEVEN